MATIVWLDDEPLTLLHAADVFRRVGHEVDLVDSEERAIKALSSPRATLLIQDLMRPVSDAQVDGGTPRKRIGTDTDSGWNFYRHVLRPYFPQVSVVICSLEGHAKANLKQADDFKLTILSKNDLFYPGRLVSVVSTALSTQSVLHQASAPAPAVWAVDFDKVTTELVRHLAAHPSHLHRVGWATFEALVERLLRELGYEVVRTPLTHDGGADLWAIHRSDLGEVLYAIDAKKYAPDRLVGPEPVRAIYGVADLAGASAGMIVTTSRFGPGALQLANQYRYRIALKDFEGIVAWLRIVGGNFAG